MDFHPKRKIINIMRILVSIMRVTNLLTHFPSDLFNISVNSAKVQYFEEKGQFWQFSGNRGETASFWQFPGAWAIPLILAFP